MTVMGLRATSALMVGRDRELARFDAVLGAVAGGQSAVVLVAGEAGVGKSRLIEELAARATARGVRVLAGWCVEFGEEIWPLAPLRDIVAALVDQLDGDALELVVGTARRELARLVPELGTEESSVEPLANARLCELVAGVVKRIARRGPVMLVMEDLHWADTSTRALLALLTGARDLGAVLVVGTYRSDELHRRHPLRPTLAAIERTARPERIDLTPLDAAMTGELVASLSGVAVDAKVVEGMHHRSGGNPFFVEELVAARTAGVAGPTNTLREVILARTAALDDTAVHFLRVAAAAGSATPEVLAAAGGLDTDAFRSALESSVAAALIVIDGDEVRFRHELAREVFYDDLVSGERARVHAHLARSLETLRPARLGEIARHWGAARDGAHALTTSIAAARQALRTGAAAEAEGHFDRALEWWNNLTDPEALTGIDRATLFAEGSLAAEHARHMSRAIELGLHAIAELAGGDPIREGRQWLQLADLYRFERRMDERADAVERALALIPASPPTSARAEAVASAALMCWHANDPYEGLPYAREAVAIADAVADREMRVYARNALAALLALAGELDGAQAAARAAVALCGPDVSAERTLVAYNGLMNTLRSEEWDDEFFALAERGVAVARDSGLGGVWGAWMAHKWICELVWFGRWNDAEHVVNEQRDLLDHPSETGQLAAGWGLALIRQGRLDEARPLIEDARSQLASGYNDEVVALIGAPVVELDAHDQHYETVAILVDDILGRSRSSLAFALAELVALGVAAQADRAELARAHHDDNSVANADAAAAAWIDHLERPDRRQWQHSDGDALYLDLAKAELARLRGQTDPARWARIAEGWKTERSPYYEAYARWRHAEALLAGTHGRTTAARHAATAQLNAARDIAERLRATPLLTNINGLARRGRLSPATAPPLNVAPPTPPAARSNLGLTARERDVLEMLASGASNGEIAKALYINTKTASVHVSNILRKLGVTNRIEAAAIANREQP